MKIKFIIILSYTIKSNLKQSEEVHLRDTAPLLR